MTQAPTNSLPTSIVATISITNLGGNDEPLVAARFLVDGREVALPFVAVLGGMVVTGNLSNPEVRGHIAKAVLQAGTDLALSLVPKSEAPQSDPEPHNHDPATTSGPQT